MSAALSVGVAPYRYLEPAELDELRQWLVDQAEDIASCLLGYPQIRTRHEYRWGRGNGSLALERIGRKRGLWLDRADGRDTGGDMLDMIQTFSSAKTFPEAIEWALQHTGYQPPSRSSHLTPEQRRARIAQMEADRVLRAEQQAKRAAVRRAERDKEDAAAIAAACALDAGKMSLAGTPGEIYLTVTRKIPEPEGGYGPDVAWHPAQRALIVSARSPAGTVTAVQLIRLTPTGEKRQPIGGLIKKTVGRLSTAEGRSVLKMPGRSDFGYLQHAEGPETGLSVWAATGIETWIALGSGGEPQRDRMNIMLADDDAADSSRAAGLQRSVAAWDEARIPVIVATPWATPRGNRSDFNDVMKEGGLDAVCARIATALAASLHLTVTDAPRALPTASLPEVRDGLKVIVQNWLKVPPDSPGSVVLCQVESGIGKTHEIIEALPLGERDIYLVPDHKVLGEQVTERLRAKGHNVAHLKGRGDPFDPKPDDLCGNLEAVKHAIIAGLPVTKSCCGEGCPVFDRGECKFLKNFSEAVSADVVVASHKHLTGHLQKAIYAGATRLIIDEDPTGNFDWIYSLDNATFSAAALERWPVLLDGKPDVIGTEQLAGIYQKLREATAGGQLNAATMAAAGLTAEDVAKARTTEWNRRVPAEMTPRMRMDERREISEAASINSLLGKFVAFWNALYSMATEGTDGAGRVEYVLQSNPIRQEFVVRTQKKLASWTNGMSVALLNATASLENTRHHFPTVVEYRSERVAAPHSTVVQILGGFSRGSMKGSAKKRNDLNAFLEVISPGRDKALIGHKSSAGEFSDMPNTRVTWHGRNAGDDSFRDIEVCAVLDGTRANSKDLANLAAARTGRDVKAEAPAMSTESVLMEDGIGIAIPVLRYENRDLQTAHESIHHPSNSQALARPRQILRGPTNPALALNFGNVAADRPVGVIINWGDVRPDRLVHMVHRDRILSNAADMRKWHPKLFTSQKAAATARERFGDIRRRITAMLNLDPKPWVKVRFQPAGQGQHVHTAFCPAEDIKAMRAEAEGHYGHLVYWDVAPFTAGRKKDIPIDLKLDLWAMGMTSKPVPVFAPLPRMERVQPLQLPPDG